MPRTTVQENVDAALELIASGVPIQTAFLAKEISEEKYRQLKASNPDLKDRVKFAEAKAYATLVQVAFQQSQLGETAPLNNLLQKRFNIDNAPVQKALGEVIEIADAVLPREWFIKFLAALEEANL